MREWTAAPHQESPSAASRQAFCRRGARRRNQACEKVRTERYRYAAPPDAYPCASIPCIGHSSRCRNLTLSRWRHFGRPVTKTKNRDMECSGFWEVGRLFLFRGREFYFGGCLKKLFGSDTSTLQTQMFIRRKLENRVRKSSRKILRPLRGRKSDFYAQKVLLRGPKKWRSGGVKVTFPLRIFAGINI